MIKKCIKKIWFFCLCLAGLSLTGCFHIPDEDWLPSRNKVNTENVKKDEEIEQAVNSLMQWIDTISSDWSQVKYGENVEIYTGELKGINNEATDENINNEEIVNDEITNWENENQEVYEDTIPEE